MHHVQAAILFAVLLSLAAVASAQATWSTTAKTITPTTWPMAQAVLPGGGLAQSDFFYAGEFGRQRMFIVKAGQVVWSCDDRPGAARFGDLEQVKTEAINKT